MSTTDDLLRNAEEYASSFVMGELPLPPAKGVAVVACMDSRLIPTKVLGELGRSREEVEALAADGTVLLGGQ